MVNKRVFLFLGAAVLVGVSVSAGYFMLFGSSSTTPYGGLEKIAVGNAGQLSILHLIAADQGYFKQNGLEAEIREFNSGASTVDALLASEVDIAVSAEFVGVKKIFEGDDLVVLAQVAERRGNVYRLVARKDKGIHTPADLAGKKIGVTKKTVGDFYLGRFLTFHGLRYEDITAIDLPPPELSERIQKGEIDAAVSFEPNAYTMEQSLKDNAVSWSAQGNLNAFGLAYARRGFVERNPSIIKRYIRALIQAKEYLNDHNEESRAFIARTLNYDESYMDYVWTSLDAGVELSQDLLLAMEVQARWLIRNGFVGQTDIPNYLDYIHFEALEDIRPDAVTVIH